MAKISVAGFKEGLSNFSKSGEHDALWGGVGALAGVMAVPYTPQLPLGSWAKVSNILYGAALMILGAWAKKGAFTYFLVGLGLAYLVDGLVRTFIPGATTTTSYAPVVALETWKSPGNNYSVVYNNTG